MQPSPESAAAPATRLRVLIVTDEMEVGGSQRQIVNLALGLDPAQHEVTVAYFRNGSFFVDTLRQGGVRVVELPKRGRIDARFLAALVRELRTGRYDLVHAFAFSAEFWTALSCAALPPARRPQLVTSIRGTYDWYGAWHWRAKRWVSRRSSRVVANSRMGADFAAQRMGVSAAGIDVIYNGVAAEPVADGSREAVRAAWQVSPEQVVVLFVGRLVDVKDVGTLLRAAGRLVDSGLPLRYALCGDGPLRAALEQQAADLGLGSVARFLGERRDVAALIEAADMVVLPSRQEGLSNVILEAMRGARPVVATRAGGNVELVEPGVTGLLFEVGDDEALAGCLRQLALDNGLRNDLGRAGARRVQDCFDMRAMVGAFARLYRDTHRRAALRGGASHPG